jgi:DNA-binding LacI/PurR family transcriptional regulator/DNA-binding transcriptional regulator YhcF (GntR family)
MDTRTHAYEMIKQRLESSDWTPGERMPSLAALAEGCGVSRTTMWKALTMLRNEALVCTKKGGAIFAGAPQDAIRPTLPVGKLLWERVRTNIGRDIISSAFTGNRLPTTNKLTLQYNVAVCTVKKALDGLVKEGLLVQAGRRYMKSPFRNLPGTAPILLIAESGIITVDSRLREIAACFERECVKQGYAYRFEKFSVRDTRALIDIEAAIGTMKEIRGCIVSIWNPWDETLRKRWFDLLGYLVDRKTPVIILDQAGNLPIPAVLLRNKWLRVLRVAGVRAGEMAAQALVRSGHRHIAFIAPSFDYHWVQERYSGFCRYLRQYSGAESTVEPYAHSRNPDHYGPILAVLKLDKKDVGILFRGRYSREEVLDLQRIAQQVFREHSKWRIKADQATKTIRSMARLMVALARQKHDSDVFNEELERLLTLAANKAIELSVRPLFAKILARSRATAWVFAEEKSALAAVSYLRNRGIRVPGDVAVFGFDNWRENFEHQLPTYDFNMSGMVQRALLLIADAKSFKSQPVVNEIDGYVVERKGLPLLKPVAAA